ncbi:MAG: DUF1905 domain-containing protein [Chitinophagales bacterium]|jgi:hypothetical protein|nr:DUF1905 domain-containing protein [Chitinophagales bacterium]
MIYEFSAEVFIHTATGGWFLVKLPREDALSIRSICKQDEQGWGRLKVTAYIKSTSWKTSIWFDTKSQTYLLPIKAGIRKIESIEVNQIIDLKIIMDN